MRRYMGSGHIIVGGKPNNRQRAGFGRGLSVSHKGLLMVGVPLVLQLVCLLTLGWMLYWQSVQVENHFHVRVMQENMGALLKSALDSGITLMKFRVNNDEKYLQQFDDELAGAGEAMDRLEAESRGVEKEYIVPIRKDFDAMMEFAKDARDSMTTGSRLESIGTGLQLKKSGSKLIGSLQKDIGELETELMAGQANEGPAEMHEQTMRLLKLIGLASLFALGLAFAVHRFFTDLITQRLKTLTDNTVRLARSEALHPPDLGTDEIGHLDRVFHDMANALAEAARKERAVIQHARDVICSLDSEGRFTAVSPAAVQLWGYSPEELIDRKIFDLVVPDDLHSTHLSFARIRDDEEDPQPFETRVSKKDGTVVYILWSAYWANSEQSMFCVAHDITDRKLAEDQLRASEARVRSIFESAPVALLVLDNSGRINLLNPRAESMFGYRMEQLVDRHFSSLVPKSSEFNEDQFTRETLEQLVGRVRELEAVDREGRLFPIELTFDHYQTAEGDRYLAAVLDVSERHEVERLKREFVSTVSHELRTPLTAIRGSLTLLAVGALGKLGDQADKAVKIAERNCLRLINLINDLLDIEKLEAGKLEMVYEESDFTPVVERSVESVRAFGEQYGVAIETSIAGGKVCADADRLVQVLVNLLSNAIKYSPRESSVTVRVQNKKDALRVEVIDRGRGIPADYKDKVFERFQQVETADSKKKGGTGLGLAICKAIVEQHNGAIGVESEEGKGSTFWFEVPLAGSPAALRLIKREVDEVQPLVVKISETVESAVLKVPDPAEPEPVLKINQPNKVAEERK